MFPLLVGLLENWTSFCGTYIKITTALPLGPQKWRVTAHSFFTEALEDST